MKTSVGRGNLSFTTINLVRLAFMAKRDAVSPDMAVNCFFQYLYKYANLVADQLRDRYLSQCSAHKYQFPLLMGKMWKGCEKLKENDTLESVLKHGTLGIGFIGLAEALIVRTGHHHGESEEAQTWFENRW